MECIARINAWLRGWHGFFGIASATEMRMMRTLDAHIRRRFRAIMLRHWKRKRTIARVSSSWASNEKTCGGRSTQDGSPGGR